MLETIVILECLRNYCDTGVFAKLLLRFFYASAVLTASTCSAVPNVQRSVRIHDMPEQGEESQSPLRGRRGKLVAHDFGVWCCPIPGPPSKSGYTALVRWLVEATAKRFV